MFLRQTILLWILFSQTWYADATARVCHPNPLEAYERCKLEYSKCRLTAPTIDAVIKTISSEDSLKEHTSSHLRAVERILDYQNVNAVHYRIAPGGVFKAPPIVWNVVSELFLDNPIQNCLIDYFNPHGDPRTILRIARSDSIPLGYGLEGETLILPGREALNRHIDAWNSTHSLEAKIPIFFYEDAKLGPGENLSFLQGVAGHKVYHHQRSLAWPMADKGVTFYHDHSYHIPMVILPRELLDDMQTIAQLTIEIYDLLSRQGHMALAKEIANAIGRGWLDARIGSLTLKLVNYETSDLQDNIVDYLKPIYGYGDCVLGAMDRYLSAWLHPKTRLEWGGRTFSEEWGRQRYWVLNALSSKSKWRLKFEEVVAHGKVVESFESRWKLFRL